MNLLRKINLSCFVTIFPIFLLFFFIATTQCYALPVEVEILPPNPVSYAITQDDPLFLVEVHLSGLEGDAYVDSYDITIAWDNSDVLNSDVASISPSTSGLHVSGFTDLGMGEFVHGAPVAGWDTNKFITDQPDSFGVIRLEFTTISIYNQWEWHEEGTVNFYITDASIHGSTAIGIPPYQLPVIGITEVNPVPEPATMLLLGTGLVGVAGAARRKKKNQA